MYSGLSSGGRPFCEPNTMTLLAKTSKLLADRICSAWSLRNISMYSLAFCCAGSEVRRRAKTAGRRALILTHLAVTCRGAIEKAQAPKPPPVRPTRTNFLAGGGRPDNDRLPL